MNAFVDELRAYVGFGGEDIARLRTLHAALAPQFPDIANEFYAAVLANPGAAAVLSGPEQIERLRVTLIDWMSWGLLGPYDDAFYASRSRIGKRHAALGLAQHYMFAAMNVIRAGYVARIGALFPRAQVFPYIRSVDKLLDLELAMMLHDYQAGSEDRLVRRERRQQSDQLAAMQTLSSGLAHEIRNPLNSAKLQLELLERRLRRKLDDTSLTEPTALAHHEIERLGDLVNDFLAFAQPSSMYVAGQDLVVIAHHVIELERPLALRRGVELQLVAGGEVHACVDATKLHQIIQNLLRNAIEAVAPGGHVALRIDEDADRVHVRVIDDGPGIPDRVRARMFEPFFSTKESGTGLGMSIVHSFVAMHGGTIGVVSTPAGTEFDVTLPRD
jgi:signal transduction histidine kinase